MKSRGITRKADSMGRIVIPMEIRRSLGIVEKDSLEMFIEEESDYFTKISISKSLCTYRGYFRQQYFVSEWEDYCKSKRDGTVNKEVTAISFKIK